MKVWFGNVKISYIPRWDLYVTESNFHKIDIKFNVKIQTQMQAILYIDICIFDLKEIEGHLILNLLEKYILEQCSNSMVIYLVFESWAFLTISKLALFTFNLTDFQFTLTWISVSSFIHETETSFMSSQYKSLMLDWDNWKYLS